MKALEKAETAARQIVVAARQSGVAVTRNYIDVILTRDANMSWGDANVRSVRMMVRKLAILSTDVIALTDREEVAMHRARFAQMNLHELNAIGDEIADNEDDRRGWDRNFVHALSVARKAYAPKRLR